MTAQPPVALVVEDDEAIRALYVAAFRLPRDHHHHRDSSAVKAIDRSLVRAVLFKPINVKALIAYATEVVEEKRAAR